MANSYKQRIFADLDHLLDDYPNAKVSDTIWALEAMAEALWRMLPAPKKGRRMIERSKRYRVV